MYFHMEKRDPVFWLEPSYQHGLILSLRKGGCWEAGKDSMGGKAGTSHITRNVIGGRWSVSICMDYVTDNRRGNSVR